MASSLRISRWTSGIKRKDGTEVLSWKIVFCLDRSAINHKNNKLHFSRALQRGLLCVCVCVCARVRACLWVRERERGEGVTINCDLDI
jgi:hypothetical protein